MPNQGETRINPFNQKKEFFNNGNWTEIGDTYTAPTGATIDQATGQMINTSSVITADNLKPATAFPLVSENEVPIYPVKDLNSEFTPALEMTKPELESSDLIKKIMGLTEQGVGESAYRAEQEKVQGIPDLQKTQQDLSARLTALKNEALAIPMQLQQESIGRGRTTGGLQPLQTAALRNNAIQSLSVASLLEASRGNLTLAQDYVDRAVSQKFDPIKERISALTANLNLILKSPEYSIAEKNRAQRQLDIQNAKAAQAAKQEADAKKIYDVSLLAAQNGADSETLQALQNARDPQEALAIAGNVLGAEFRLKTDEYLFNKQMKQAEYDLSIKKFKEDIRQFGESQALQYAKLLYDQNKDEIKALEEQGKTVEAQALALESVKGKIDLIKDITNSKGLDSRVGPTAFARRAWEVGDIFGAGQEFAGSVHLLTQKETLDALTNLKAKGGTLGALSEGERIMLAESATKLNSWELKDKNGNGKGEWDIDETSFKKELKRLQDLANKAYERATGITPLSSSDLKDINSIYGVNADQTFNPANYY